MAKKIALRASNNKKGSCIHGKECDYGQPALFPTISKHIDANWSDIVRSCTHKERTSPQVPDQETRADKTSANEKATVTIANIARRECAGRQYLIARGNTSLGGVFSTTEGNSSINGNFIRQVSSILKLSPMEPSQKVCVKFSTERLERTTSRDKKPSLNMIQTGSKMRETPNFLPHDQRSTEVVEEREEYARHQAYEWHKALFKTTGKNKDFHEKSFFRSYVPIKAKATTNGLTMSTEERT